MTALLILVGLISLGHKALTLSDLHRARDMINDLHSIALASGDDVISPVEASHCCLQSPSLPHAASVPPDLHGSMG